MTDWRYWVTNADCVATMLAMRPDSIDAIVTDPPYEIAFMGKGWDNAGVAFSIDTWKAAYHVLKPGGHLLAFGATRTYHRMAVAIEDAGFEIRDSIHWMYGTGFPKSHDVSKAIDKLAGADRQDVYADTEKVTTNEVYGKGLGVAVLERRPLPDDARKWNGWGTALKPAHEPIIVARKPLEGTVAQNVLKQGTGAINIDGCRVGTEMMQKTQSDGTFKSANSSMSGHNPASVVAGHVEGRWPANVILDEDAAVELDEQSGPAGAAARACVTRRTGSSTSVARGHYAGTDQAAPFYADSGGASRFFYVAKPSKGERNRGMPEGEKNDHPTVKPVQLMRYLVRLVTPPDGVVLDPFCGSGTTLMAALEEGVRVVGIEQSAAYAEIARHRAEYVQNCHATDRQEAEA